MNVKFNAVIILRKLQNKVVKQKRYLSEKKDLQNQQSSYNFENFASL